MMMTSGSPSEQKAPVQSKPEDDYLSVELLRKQYLDYVTVKRDEINEQRESRHYYHCDQWTDKQAKELKRRRQPIVTYNRVARKIDGVVGLVERLKQDPKAYPRTPQHEEGAEIASATIRYALDACDWSSKASEAARQAAMIGLGGVELILERGDKGDPEPSLELVDGDTYFYDPRSFRQDFSDARFEGIAKWMDLDAAQEMFPDKSEELSALISDGSGLEGNQQQDREKKWIDTDKKRLLLVEHWYKQKGKWCYCFYTAKIKLEEGVSPFVNERGKSISKFIMFSANVDHDGDRYGFVRNLKSAQDEFNHRRSKSLHLLNSRRIMARNGSLANPEKTRQEASRPDGMILWDIEKPEFDDARAMADMKGQMEFAANAATEIENFGPNPALLGQGVENKSGRAIALLQQAGISELGPFVIALRAWKIRVYRTVWNVIQQTWTSERWVRVTDNDGLAQFIKVNGLDGTNPDLGPQIVNALGSLDVDIILDEGPDTMNMMQDAFETMLSLAQSGAQVPPMVMIELSQLPSDVKKRVKDMMMQAAQPSQEQQAAQQIALEGEAAKVEETRSKTAKNLADAGKTQVDAHLAPMNAMQQAASVPEQAY